MKRATCVVLPHIASRRTRACFSFRRLQRCVTPPSLHSGPPHAPLYLLVTPLPLDRRRDLGSIVSTIYQMAVKDLVGHYESRSKLSASTSPASSSKTREQAPSQSSGSLFAVPSKPVEKDDNAPAPSPAKFLSHSLLRRREPSSADQEDDPILADSTISESSTPTYVPEDRNLAAALADADVTDELNGLRDHHRNVGHSSSLARSSGWGKSAVTAFEDSSAIELNPLLSSATGSSSRPGSATVFKPYHSSSSTTTLVPTPHNLGPHTPLPLSQILARNAAPVSLPKLDDYISGLEMPSFPECHIPDSGKGKGRGKGPDVAMFPPMERLVGTTLVDLENNAKIPPAWRNRQSIFGSLLNVALGITVSACSTSNHQERLISIYHRARVQSRPFTAFKA